MTDDQVHLLTACGLPFLVTLPFGVHATALGLEYGDDWSRIWLGLSLVVVGIFALECFWRSVAVVKAEAGRTPRRGHHSGPRRSRVRRLSRDLFIAHVGAVLCMQLLTVNMFFLMLDGHVHLRACCWLYLVYATGAGFVLALQRGRPTGWGSCYLRWGWAPIIALGVPLALPTLKAAGMVPFSPLSW
jgi:hypothetical protein